MADVNTYENYYFIGIGGIGMSTLARYFHSVGKKVAGYDKTHTKLTNALQTEGITINFDDVLTNVEENLTPENTLIVFTPAIKNLKILDYFTEKGFTIMKRAKVLGILTETT